jgi:hypothetical protein
MNPLWFAFLVFAAPASIWLARLALFPSGVRAANAMQALRQTLALSAVILIALVALVSSLPHFIAQP